MKFVTMKAADQFDLQALHRVRKRLVSQRTGIINQIRAFLLERNIAVRKGHRFLRAEPIIRKFIGGAADRPDGQARLRRGVECPLPSDLLPVHDCACAHSSTSRRRKSRRLAHDPRACSASPSRDLRHRGERFPWSRPAKSIASPSSIGTTTRHAGIPSSGPTPSSRRQAQRLTPLQAGTGPTVWEWPPRAIRSSSSTSAPTLI